MIHWFGKPRLHSYNLPPKALVCVVFITVNNVLLCIAIVMTFICMFLYVLLARPFVLCFCSCIFYLFVCFYFSVFFISSFLAFILWFKTEKTLELWCYIFCIKCLKVNKNLIAKKKKKSTRKELTVLNAGCTVRII